MSSCEEAQYHLKECGNGRLDRDNDGVPCEAVCQ
ncbi:excalibur calcium-binding domain-containing protein [Azotobacter chroococcum]|nr:excalibur calcium-binding domain-containing protein [Azotobacter chroococcum]